MRGFAARLAIGAGLGLVAGAMGCAKQVTLDVNLVTSACVDPNVAAVAPAGPTTGVDTLRFLVSFDGGVSLSPVDVPVGQDAVKLPLIPFDQQARVDVFGLGSGTAGSRTPLSFGSSGDFMIPSSTGQSTVSLTITLRRTNSFSEQPQVSNAASCASMVRPRAYHSQTLLPNGQVLIYGGLQFASQTVDWSRFLGMPAQPLEPPVSYLSDVEIFDPATGTFIDAGTLASSAVAQAAVPVERAFGSVLASLVVDGGALLIGGETPAQLGDAGLLVGAANGAYYSPTDAGWTPRRLDPHGHGCITSDQQLHGMAASGLDSTGAASAAGEFLDLTVWPPLNHASVPFPVSDAGEGLTEARADQACGGFLGLLGDTATLVAEAGGFTTDSAGKNTALLGDLYFYNFGDAGLGNNSFVPLFVQGGPAVQQLTAGARTRSKAAAFSVIDQMTMLPSDALLVTGGLSCDVGSGDAGCRPTFLDGGTSGQLGAPIASYFPPGMKQTELLAFPQSGGSADITVVAGPNLNQRVDHCAVTLPDGRALILGGLGPYADGGGFGTLNDAVYTAAVPSSDLVAVPTLTPVASALEVARAGMACTVLHDGSVLVTGGFTTTGPLIAGGSSQPVSVLRSAEIYTPMPISITAPAGP